MTIEVTKADTVATWLGVSASFLMAIFAAIYYAYMRREKRYKWVLFLVGICIVQDIGATSMFVALHV